VAASGAQVGYRNQLRAWWRTLPEHIRWLITIGIEFAVSLLLWAAVDESLGYAAAVIFTIMWLRKMPPLPWRLATEAAVVGVFGIGWIAGSTPGSIPLALALAFAISWIPGRFRWWSLPLLAVLIAIVYPFFVGHLFTIPVFGAFPDVPTAIYMIVFMTMAVGLNIVVGYAGLLDLGYVAFYAIGAYTAGWFASAQFAGQKCSNPHFGIDNCPAQVVPRLTYMLGAIGVPQGTGGIHLSIFLVVLIAGVITALFGILIGLPTLRLRGDYLAIVTLGFGEILPQIARNGDNLFGFNLTNGANGITPIDSPGFGHHLSSLTGGVVPAYFLNIFHTTIWGHTIQSYDLFFWTALVLLAFVVFCSLRLRDSRLGRAWIAIREDETAAAAMGIPLMRTKTWAYAGGAFFGGMAGAYYASEKSGTFPDDFFFNISVFVLCMVILGGMGNVWGVLLGAALLSYLNKFGLGNIGFWINQHVDVVGYHPNINVPLYASGIYGLIIVVVMLFRPEGLLPSRRRKRELHATETHDEYLYDVRHEGA
jgi:branched-chain amino acid transport system permease protein